MENNPLANRIEAYFAALEAPLNELPAARQEEFLLEARAHVQSMVEARRADGLDELAAWDSALADFGDPQEVGRALWREWASSGQLESEGAPLSVRDLFRKYGLRMIWLVPFVLLMVALPITVWGSPYFMTTMAIVLVGSFGWAIRRYRRGGGQWTTSVILSYGVQALFLLNLTVHLLGGQSWSASATIRFVDQWFPFAVCGLCGLCLYFYKRELPQRPWRFGAYAIRYKQSPVAAEQEYRFGPLIGFTIGASFGCVSLLVIGFQSFGIAPALWFFAGSVGVGSGLAFWLKK